MRLALPTAPAAVLPADLPLEGIVRIRGAFTRAINLARDSDSLDLIRAYVPTSRAIAALSQIADGLGHEPASRALALIGPYGSGKSAFALFLGALLSAPESPLRQAALATLRGTDPALADRIGGAVAAPRGFLRVQINGIPDSFVRQSLLGLAAAAERNGIEDIALIKSIRAAARPGTPMDHALDLIGRVQAQWGKLQGAGLLIEIDELGKFLEYESYHPQHREIHLLQLLAEKAAEASPIPLHLVVMLHQAFEHYGNRLGSSLREEWQKVQGRFGAIAFLEPAEQSLRVVGAAFERDGDLPPAVIDTLAETARQLDAAGALPLGMDRAAACALFQRCYPLHPLALLILPVLCQKIAQNERTLFSYLASAEPFGLRQRLGQLALGDWIAPWELYDYFVLNQSAAISDPLTYHRWMEVITAHERFVGDERHGGSDADPALRVLKTVGLFNLIGAQRGLKASPPVLDILFGPAAAPALVRLEGASLVRFRGYAQEYRVWQGSDFDLPGALKQTAAEHAAQPLADTLNALAPLRPIVARRASIETGTLRSFTPAFVSRERWPPKPVRGAELTLWFYLAEHDERPNLAKTPPHGVVAVCRFAERLREVVAEWTALQDLPRHHAALHEDPVARREHRAWLQNAETEAVSLLRTLVEEPQALRWHFGGERMPVGSRRELQARLSEWVTDHCYPDAPLVRNELINREQPSASAATGRKRLLAAMLAGADRDGLGIDKAPAEKSLYLSLLKESGLHRVKDGRRDFYPPPYNDPCNLRPLWDAISATLREAAGQRVGVPTLYARLQAPPFGVRLGVLPILLVAYLLAHRRELALYQEDAFCECLTVEQAELLCRRPALFALERFELVGLRGELFDRYLSSVVGNVRDDAGLLDIVRPLVRFAANLPEYAQHCPDISPEAAALRGAFREAKSPGVLLFESLPRACGIDPVVFAADDPAPVERFVARLIAALRELKDAYPALLAAWRQEIGSTLIGDADLELAALRQGVAERYRGLDRYTPERGALGAFVRRLADPGLPSDQAWLESVMTLLGGAPPAKWREASRLQAQLRLADFADQLRDLERLRQAMPDADAPKDALLVKLVDVERGEISRVLRLSGEQRQRVVDEAERIAASLAGLDASARLGVAAALLKRLTDDRTAGATDDD